MFVYLPSDRQWDCMKCKCYVETRQVEGQEVTLLSEETVCPLVQSSPGWSEQFHAGSDISTPD